MFYYVKLDDDDEIIQKGTLSEFTELSYEFKEISQELYESMGAMPCSFVENETGIINIEYIEPIIQPETPKQLTETELLGQQLVDLELQNLDIQSENQSLGQQMVDIDLRLLNGGL